jgi:hypothetical protein
MGKNPQDQVDTETQVKLISWFWMFMFEIAKAKAREMAYGIKQIDLSNTEAWGPVMKEYFYSDASCVKHISTMASGYKCKVKGRKDILNDVEIFQSAFVASIIVLWCLHLRTLSLKAKLPGEVKDQKSLFQFLLKVDKISFTPTESKANWVVLKNEKKVKGYMRCILHTENYIDFINRGKKPNESPFTIINVNKQLYNWTAELNKKEAGDLRYYYLLTRHARFPDGVAWNRPANQNAFEANVNRQSQIQDVDTVWNTLYSRRSAIETREAARVDAAKAARAADKSREAEAARVAEDARAEAERTAAIAERAAAEALKRKEDLRKKMEDRRKKMEDRRKAEERLRRKLFLDHRRYLDRKKVFLEKEKVRLEQEKVRREWELANPAEAARQAAARQAAARQAAEAARQAAAAAARRRAVREAEAARLEAETARLEAEAAQQAAAAAARRKADAAARIKGMTRQSAREADAARQASAAQPQNAQLKRKANDALEKHGKMVKLARRLVASSERRR